jgi:uroporphyrinogen-III synthase
VNLPLAGRRILVTRAQTQAGKLSEGLRALGAEAVEVPVIEICPPASYDALDAALRRLSTYDWLFLTSTNAVHVFAGRAQLLGLNLRSMSRLKVAAVGKATSDRAEKAGLTVNFVPESYVAECLVSGLPEQISGKRILLARAAIARDVIPIGLRQVGATVEVVDAYENRMPESAPALLREALSSGIDAATFTSSSSVTHLAEAVRAAGLAWPFTGVAAVSIGPITSSTLRELGWAPAAEAAPYDIPGLIKAVEKALAPPLPFSRNDHQV